LPAQQTVNQVLTNAIKKISFINSLSTLVVIAAAGWILFAADKYLRRLIFAA
jgi:uncharacterized membrane protein